MAWPFLIAASTALLLGAAGPARGDFFGDLREAVELSEKQQAGEGEADKTPEAAGAAPVSERGHGGGKGAGATGAATRADVGKSGGSRGRGGAGSSRK